MNELIEACFLNLQKLLEAYFSSLMEQQRPLYGAKLAWIRVGTIRPCRGWRFVQKIDVNEWVAREQAYKLKLPQH